MRQDIVASFIATTITFATPLTLGALSGIYCERSGVVNIAIVGMMLGACFFGFIGASWFKSQGVPDQAALWLGVLVATLTGFLFAALHAVLSIRFKVNQIISGTVINILAVGLTGYLNRQLFFQQGAAPLQSAGTLSRMPIPQLSDLPLIGGIFNQPPITYLALILVHRHAVCNVQDRDMTTWWGLMGPAGMNADVVQRLSAEILKTMDAPEVQARLRAMSMEGSTVRTPEQFTAFVDAERKLYARLVRQSGAKPD